MKMSWLCLTSVLLVLLTCLVTVTQCDKKDDSPVAPPAFCWDPPYQGPCKARKMRWFFNSYSGLCEPFVYGGCKAKRNHFLERERCLSTCGGIEPEPMEETQEPEVEPGPGQEERGRLLPRVGLAGEQEEAEVSEAATAGLRCDLSILGQPGSHDPAMRKEIAGCHHQGPDLHSALRSQTTQEPLKGRDDKGREGVRPAWVAVAQEHVGLPVDGRLRGLLCKRAVKC
ncbi:Pancreatic trypsin inhibitor [Galemys pyrenaicus]|uniref:Pancreatic trypsin inhibitor n=1 Tax=Galemys pyrenaicus TaxID=202257 RepID=A0A8J6DT70_GALPY|nr:Pancreatic trypsin inhibitor [Galemys pyrenaicus]